MKWNAVIGYPKAASQINFEAEDEADAQAKAEQWIEQHPAPKGKPPYQVLSVAPQTPPKAPQEPQA